MDKPEFSVCYHNSMADGLYWEVDVYKPAIVGVKPITRHNRVVYTRTRLRQYVNRLIKAGAVQM